MEKTPVADTPKRPRTTARRHFLYKAATLGAVTPATVTLLLAAGTKRSKAANPYKK